MREIVVIFGVIVVVFEVLGKLKDVERYVKVVLELNYDDYLSFYTIFLLDIVVKLGRKLDMNIKIIER